MDLTDISIDLQIQIDLLKKDNLLYSSTINDLLQQICNLKSDIEFRNKEIDCKDKEIDCKDKEIDCKNKEIDCKNKEIHDLKNKNIEKTTKQDSHGFVSKVMSSLYWK